jgi:small subunit ribosomal protein S18
MRRRKVHKKVLYRKKVVCPFEQAGIEEIDYKDIALLRNYIRENGKIIPSRFSGVSAKYQRQLTKAVKRARQLVLIPVTSHHQSAYYE